jgi:hypothetical protein
MQGLLERVPVDDCARRACGAGTVPANVVTDDLDLGVYNVDVL